MAEDNKKIELIAQEFSLKMEHLIETMQKVSESNNSLTRKINELEMNFSQVQVESRLKKIENWKDDVGNVWNIEGMKETKNKAQDSKEFIIKAMTVYAVLHGVLILAFMAKQYFH